MIPIMHTIMLEGTECKDYPQRKHKFNFLDLKRIGNSKATNPKPRLLYREYSRQRIELRRVEGDHMYGAVSLTMNL